MKINKDNYREVLIQYLERELSRAENAEVEQYIRENEAAVREIELLRRTTLVPDQSIGFPNKQLLFREEDNRTIGTKTATVVKLMRFAAFALAAAFIGFGIIIFLNRGVNTQQAAYSRPGKQVNTPSEHPGVDNMTAEKSKDSKKRNHSKNDNNNKNQKKGNLKDQQKESNSPNLEQEHRTILLVNQPEDKDYMALININMIHIDNSEGQRLQNFKEITGNNLSINPLDKNQHSGVQVAENNTLIENFMDFLEKVSVKRKEVNDKTYYALSIETNNIKIDKTFKSLIQQ